MESEIKHILKRQAETIEENNKMLKKLVRIHRWSVFVTTLKWVIIIGVAIGIFTFLQPIVENIREIYQNSGSIPETVVEFIGNSEG